MISATVLTVGLQAIPMFKHLKIWDAIHVEMQAFQPVLHPIFLGVKTQACLRQAAVLTVVIACNHLC